jgi:hypothetical protein
VASRKATARIAGGVYLAYIVLTVVANATRDRLVVPGDAAATAANVVASAPLFRVSFVSDVLAGVLFLVTAWALYVLLKPVRPDVALLFVLLNLAGVAVQCLNMLNFFAAGVILGVADAPGSIVEGGSPALAMLFLELYRNGFMIAQFFFAAWVFPLGYLVLTSGYLPRLLGVILMVEAVAWLLYPLQHFLLPALDGVSYVSSVVGFIGEFSLALWLLIMGAKEDAPAPAHP